MLFRSQFVCAYNCARTPANKRKFAREAASHWTNLFKFPEDASRSLLLHALGMAMDAERGEVLSRLKQFDAKYFDKSTRAGDAGFLTWFAEFYEKILDKPSALAQAARQARQLLSGLRNVTAHGGVGRDLDALITVAGNNWRAEFDALDEKVASMCKLIVDFSAELDSRGLDI